MIKSCVFKKVSAIVLVANLGLTSFLASAALVDESLDSTKKSKTLEEIQNRILYFFSDESDRTFSELYEMYAGQPFDDVVERFEKMKLELKEGKWLAIVDEIFRVYNEREEIAGEMMPNLDIFLNQKGIVDCVLLDRLYELKNDIAAINVQLDGFSEK